MNTWYHQRILKVNTIAGIDKYPRDYRKIIILLNNNYSLITHQFKLSRNTEHSSFFLFI
jgi:hypothetical protein